jgi:hypothetical protein
LFFIFILFYFILLTMQHNHHIISEQPYGSSKKIQFISNMTPMESLLSAIDSAHPIHLPYPTKRNRPSSPQQSMSIESMLDSSDFRPSKRHCTPLSPPPQSPPPMYYQKPSTVTCYHASVAQKSYGSEKRFLCPPPIVMMSDAKQSPIVSMSVMCETNGDRQLEQRTLLDENMRGSFKYLFVTGTAKAKQFCLRVNLQQQHQQHQQQQQQQLQPYASFFSSPISIISKPSKKTAKARNISTCLFTNSYVSLFNRINSQTVRTKYMTSENKQLCAKHSSWSPFEIIVVRQPNQAMNPDNHSVSVPITYGTEIILKDVNSGVSSPPLIIRKVDKGQVVHGAYGLLSQMQKIALQLSSSSNSSNPLYLNANGTAMNLQESDNNNNNGNVNHNTSAWVDFISSKQTTTNNNEKIESVDDYLCWTIVGISKFEYTFNEQPQSRQPIMDNSNNRQLSPPPSPPRSIIPFPVISSVEYASASHSLQVSGQNLMQSLPYTRLLEFYLGSYGPLPVTTKENSLTISLPDTQELLLTHHDMLITRPDGARYFELPLLLVRHDGFVYHSGKTLVYDIDLNCEHGKWSVNEASNNCGSSISSASSL